MAGFPLAMMPDVPNRRRAVATAVACGAVWSALASSQPSPLTRRASEALVAKTDGLSRNALRHPLVPGRVAITETELNSFLAFDGVPLLPTGVADLRVALLGGGRVAASAIVDLDAVRRYYGTGRWTDPLSYLGGRLPVAAAGVLASGGGTARLALESASVAGIGIPKVILQEIVAYYTRAPEYPNGVNIDAAFQLPARIRSIEVGRGVAVVVQ